MQKDPQALNKARKAERKADERSGLITIKPVKLDSNGTSVGGFKKGGFKSAFSKPEKEEPVIEASEGFKKLPSEEAPKSKEPAESDTEDEGYEMYDPNFPTA